MTPEERTKIYEEEKARKEAQGKLKAEEAAAGLKGCLAIIVIAVGIGVLVAIWSSFTSTPEQPAAKAEESFIKAGATLRLSVDGKAPVPVSIDSATHERVLKLMAAGDTVGLTQLALNGKLTVVKDGTKAKLIDVGIFTTEVRIVDGQSAGRSGIVKTVWIKKP